MGFHGRAATHKPNHHAELPSIGWSGVKLDAIGLWSSVNAFSDKSDRQINLGLADSRITLPAPTNSDNCKVWWINNGLVKS
jgi:hypothetical protein